jgi:pyruvate-formate lyase-activating enzyme
MNQLRQDFLDGQSPDVCKSCYYEDSFNKLSGRNRQLTKSGITLNEFELTARSSPHWSLFEYSNLNQGSSNYAPVDLQIDLGNTCNSACIMCDPSASSRLEQDYAKLYKIEPAVFKYPFSFHSNNWVRDPALVDKLSGELISIPNLKYIHFLGGETLYEPTFYRLCTDLITANVSWNIIVGTTTNCTIYNDKLEELIPKFKEFHLGLSIETVTPLNDYIRFPSKIGAVLNNIKKFIELRSNHPGLKLSLRITPNIFSIYELDQLLEFMSEHSLIAESCDILHNPRSLRMELLPDDIRQEVVAKLQVIVDRLGPATQQLNIRKSNLTDQVIAQIANEYLTFIKTYQTPADINESRQELVTFLKSFEQLRNNSILDYAPRYTEFLRSIGY